MKKGPALICAILISLQAGAAWAGEAELAAASNIGGMIRDQLSPESIEVTVAEGGRDAWVECTGAVMSGIRTESLKLRAALKSMPDKKTASSGTALADLITSSKGEMVLTAADVNRYFASAQEIRGFTGLNFKFSPSGYTAKGNYELNALFMKINLKLEAKGRLGLRPDGIYLEETQLFAEGMKQPDSVTSAVVGRINPLLAFSRISFPVEFKTIKMTDSEAVLSGSPEKMTQGERWSWKKQR